MREKCLGRSGRGDTPAASAADVLVSPSAEGLVVMLGGECASVSPAREGLVARHKNRSLQSRLRHEVAAALRSRLRYAVAAQKQHNRSLWSRLRYAVAAQKQHNRSLWSRLRYAVAAPLRGRGFVTRSRLRYAVVALSRGRGSVTRSRLVADAAR